MPTNTTTPYNNSLHPQHGTDPQAQVDLACWTLRQRGYTYADIADCVGYANESSARTAVNRYAATQLLRPVGQRGFYFRDDQNRHITNRRGRRANRTTSTPTPVTMEQVLGSMTFGVEIEFVGATKGAVQRELIAEFGGCIHITGYHNTRCYTCGATDDRLRWHIEHDSSVDNGSQPSSRGGEVVSPILTTASGFDQIKTVIEAIKRAGGRIDRRTGLHVHVGMRGYSNSARATALRNVATALPLLRYSVSPSRRSNTYCPFPSDGTLNRYADQFENGERPAASRYSAVNISNYNYGTFEFRCHQGTLNVRKMQNWVKLVMGICALGVTGTQLDYNSDPRDYIEQLANAGAFDDRTARYLAGRYDQMSVR